MKVGDQRGALGWRREKALLPSSPPVARLRVAILICCIYCSVGLGDPLDVWQVVEKAPWFRSVAFGNGKFVAVGTRGSVWEGGDIAISDDGVSWREVNSPIWSSDVLFENGRFWAIGWPDVVVSSTDGEVWVSQSLGVGSTDFFCSSIAYGNGKYIVIGLDYDSSPARCIALSSSDGASWTASVIPEAYRESELSFGNGTFVAVGNSGIFASIDGISWQRSTNLTGITVTFGNEKFIASVWNWTTFAPQICISSNGVDWSCSDLQISPVRFANGFFFGGEAGSLSISVDGISWSTASTGVSLGDLSYGKGKYVAVGSTGTIQSSSNGTIWAYHNVSGWLRAVTYGDRGFVSLGDYGVVLTSTDGGKWSAQNTGLTNRIFGVCFGNGFYVAVGEQGTILTSPDGGRWTARNSGTTTSLTAVAWGQNRFVAVGEGGTTLRSANGQVWEHRNSGINLPLRAITFGGEKFVAVGDRGTILTSLDGAVWSPSHHNHPTNDFVLHGVAFGNGVFVAVGDLIPNPCLLCPSRAPPYPFMFTSSDGRTWTHQDSPWTNCSGNFGLSDIAFGGGRFAATSSDRFDRIVSSTNGLDWQCYGPVHQVALSRAMAYGNDTFVVVDEWGTIVQSASLHMPPRIESQPESQHVRAGESIVIEVRVFGTPVLNYQWRKDGVDIPGATDSVLTLDGVEPVDGGGYSVAVWNRYGSVVSETAYLAVLAVDTTVQPTQASMPDPPPKEVTVDSLTVVTHGWMPKEVFRDGPPANVPWVDDMVDAIRVRVPENWRVAGFKWIRESWTALPDTALVSAENLGHLLGLILAAQRYQHLHLISHSAGAGLIQATAEAVKSESPDTTVHTTFLDAYVGIDESGRTTYGSVADWSDNYFAHDRWGDSYPGIIGWPTSATEGALTHAHNVDVTWLDPLHTETPIYCPPPPDSTVSFPCCWEAWARPGIGEGHQWPHLWYYATIRGTAPDGSGTYGFSRSKEEGGWESRGGYPVGNDPAVVLDGVPCLPQGRMPAFTGPNFNISALPHAKSERGAEIDGDVGDRFYFHFAPPIQQALAVDIKNAPQVEPVWLAIGLSITTAVNFVTFEAGFTGIGEGLVGVYWNTNQIGFVDERVSRDEWRTYRFYLPATVTNGLYALTFRLDAFNDTESSITLANVATGFTGLMAPLGLELLAPREDATPQLRITGPAGYNYLVESSTNLVDWKHFATLVNSNGTVVLGDIAVTNAAQQFYRALLP